MARSTGESEGHDQHEDLLAKAIEFAVTSWSRGERVGISRIVAAHPEPIRRELTERLRRLWRVTAPSDHRMDDAIDSGSADQDELQKVAGSIPGYAVQKKLARGAQSVVLSAVREEDGTKVAIKIMREGPFGDPAAKERFLQEASILGKLQHPGLVRVHYFGVLQEHLFLVMDLVEGEHLDTYIKRNRCSPSQTLELFWKICDALHVAHEEGIVHRDLKPDNILVTPDGEPRIVDFGLAKQIQAGNHHSVTQSGRFVGSLPWAAPEQVLGEPNKIDSRTDVYAIGVLLYETLTGRPPYPTEGSIAETIRHITETDPKRPSSYARQLDEDLDNIVLKCLEKRHVDRYGAAGQLRDEIKRYLSGEPVLAQPRPLAHLLGKLVRKHKLASALATAFLLVLVAGLVVTFAQWREADAGRKRETRLRNIADENARIAVQQAAATQREAYRAALAAADQAIERSEIREARRYLEMTPLELRGWEWSYLHSRLDDSLLQFKGHDGGVQQIAFSADSSRIATTSREGKVRLWDEATGTLLAESHPQVAPVDLVAFCGDGKSVLCIKSGRDVQRWDPKTDEITPVFALPADSRISEFLPDRMLLGLVVGNMVRYLSLETGQLSEECELQSARFESPRTVLASQHRRMAVFGLADVAEVVELPTGQLCGWQLTHRDLIEAVALTPDESRIITASRDCSIKVWDTSTGERISTLVGHTHQVHQLAVSPDGRRLASSGEDRTVRLWDLAQATQIVVFRGHEVPATSLRFSPDGKWLASGDEDGAVCVWRGDLLQDPRELGRHGRYVYGIALGDHDDILGSVGWDGFQGKAGCLKFWDRNGVCLAEHGVPPMMMTAIAASPTSRLWAVISNKYGTKESRLTIWSGEDGSVVFEVAKVVGTPDTVCFDRTGGVLGCDCGDGFLRVWDVAGSQFTLRRELPGNTLAFSPTEDLLVTASSSGGGRLDLWELSSGEQRRSIPVEASSIERIAFDLSGGRIAVACSDGAIEVFTIERGDQIARWKAHVGEAFCLLFTPDGRRIISGGTDGVVRVWDLARSQEVARLCGHTSYVYALAMTQDGKTLFSAGGDYSIRRWDAQPLSERLGGALDLNDEEGAPHQAGGH